MSITVYACRELYLLLILNLIQMKKFLLLSLFLSALYVRAAVVPVSGTETIADAVSSAVAGDIIELSEAVTYVGNVTIDKSPYSTCCRGVGVGSDHSRKAFDKRRGYHSGNRF